jgi:parallel beta-helix repeat protein
MDVTVQDVLIDGSPGMGICMTNSLNVKITNNTVKNTTRDGIYSHDSVNVIYKGNILENITDAALSMHDYGFTSGKSAIIARGYPHAGNSIIADNKIKNAFCGIQSIGLKNLTITGNHIENLVTCGIEVHNTAENYVGPDAKVENVTIANNLVSYACLASINILGKLFGDSNLGGGGKAAITVGSFGADFQYQANNKRLSNISVIGNMVKYSAADGYFLNNIDGLILNNNAALNCNTNPVPAFTGNIVECWNCTNLHAFNNSVIDDNPHPKTVAGFDVWNTTGVTGGWRIRGFTASTSYLVAPKSTYIPQILY